MSFYVISDINYNSESNRDFLGKQEQTEMTDADCARYIQMKWNDVVTDKDTVYVFGKFAEEGTKLKEMREFIKSLNGKIILCDEKKNPFNRGAVRTLGFAAVYNFSEGKPFNFYYNTEVKGKKIKINLPGMYVDNGYNMVDESTQKELYKVNNGALDISLAAQHWDFTPIVIKELNVIWENIIDEVEENESRANELDEESDGNNSNGSIDLLQQRAEDIND